MVSFLKTSYGKVSFQKVAYLVFNQGYQIFRNITQRIRTACQAATIERGERRFFFS